MEIGEAIKQSKFESSLHKAVVNLIYTGNWIRDVHQQALKPFDILPQHYNVLRIMNGRYPLPISPGEVKEVMLDKGPDLTRLLDKLQHLGWIDRNYCPENRRKTHLTLTKKGKEMVRKLSAAILKESRLLEGNLSAKESEQLSALLDKLRG